MAKLATSSIRVKGVSCDKGMKLPQIESSGMLPDIFSIWSDIMCILHRVEAVNRKDLLLIPFHIIHIEYICSLGQRLLDLLVPGFADQSGIDLTGK